MTRSGSIVLRTPVPHDQASKKTFGNPSAGEVHKSTRAFRYISGIL